MDGIKGFGTLIGIIIGVIAGTVYGISYLIGKGVTYEPEKIVVEAAYKKQITELKGQLAAISEPLEKEIAALQNKHAAEINKIKGGNASALTALTAAHEKEIIDTRDASYIQGQTAARDNIQNQIDSRAGQNMAKKDWDAPVFSTK